MINHNDVIKHSVSAGKVWEKKGGGGWRWKNGRMRENKKPVTVTDMPLEPVWPSDKALGWYAQGAQFDSALALLALVSLRQLLSADTDQML